MPFETILDDILDLRSKIQILRLFTTRTDEFMASGREVARMTALSPPAAHAALKSLLDKNVLSREIIGKQHIYRLNAGQRIVRDILKPVFLKEHAVKEDIKVFLGRLLKLRHLEEDIVSMILYGSFVRGKTHEFSDCDVAVVVKDAESKTRAENIFPDQIAPEFYKEFGFQLDPYIQTFEDFKKKMRRNKPPVSTLIRGYEVVFGKDPLEFRQGAAHE